MIKRNLLLASAMFCSVAAFAGTDMSVYQGSDVSVRVVNPNTKVKFASGMMVINEETVELSKIDSIVLKHYVSVVFEGDKVNVTNPFDSIDVKVDGASVVINSNYVAREIKYKFSGSSKNGNIIFSSLHKSKFELVDLDLTSEGVNPPIYVTTKKNTEVLLKGNNILKDSENDTVGATMRGRGQFEFKGEGSLDITGVSGHGIQSSDYVDVKNGKITIAAASDGIHVNDYYSQSGGDVNITTKADGVDVGEGYAEISGGSLKVVSAADEARGIRCTTEPEKGNAATIDIKGGKVDIQLSGKAARGLKADDNINVDGGEVLIVMSGATKVVNDDATATCGIKTDSTLNVESGRVVVICQSSAGSSRCVQADKSVNINGGVTTLYQNSIDKVTGAKKPNVFKSDGVLTVKKIGYLYVKSNDTYTKPYNVSLVKVNGVECYVDVEDEDEDEYVKNFIFAEPEFWDEYKAYNK